MNKIRMELIYEKQLDLREKESISTMLVTSLTFKNIRTSSFKLINILNYMASLNKILNK